MNARDSLGGCWDSDLPIEHARRYSRQIVVPGIQVDGQKAISAAKVLVVGAGGLGCPVLTYLAMAGVGTVGIADFDRVELHNLQRQSIHTEEKIGEYKTRSAAAFVRALNSTVNVVEHCMVVTEENSRDIIGQYDVVADCSDQAGLRYVLNDSCRILNRDLVCASVLRWEGQVYVLSKTSSCFRCVFPRAKDAAPNCDQSGVVGPMCGVIGCMQAVEVLKLLCARREGRDVGSKLILYNGFANTHKVFAKEYKRCLICEGRGAERQDVISSCAARGPAGAEESTPTLGWEEILARRDSYMIVDIRSPVHYGMFRVKGAVNFPRAEDALEQIRGSGRPVVVSCYRGISSRRAVKYLNENGVKAWSARGGIEEFKSVVDFSNIS